MNGIASPCAHAPLSDPVADLAAVLRGLNPSSLDDAETRDVVIQRLTRAWDALGGPEEHKTYAYKLRRAENVVWSPPLLHFDLERHGATVFGSTRAAVHEWVVNAEAGTARIASERVRQLYRTAPRLNVKPLATDVVTALVQRSDHPALSWSTVRTSARLRVRELIPNDGYKQTIEGRRKRFRRELAICLANTGWSIEMRGTATWLVCAVEQRAS